MAGRWGKLYRDSTPAELAMEGAIAALGVPYRNQFPYYLYGLRYFPDFLLPTLGLIVEVDDESHFRPDKVEADAQRTSDLEAEGWRVVRCTNDEALADPHGTLRGLLNSAGVDPANPSLQWPKALPSPRPTSQRSRREARQAARQAKSSMRTARRRRKQSRPAAPRTYRGRSGKSSERPQDLVP